MSFSAVIEKIKKNIKPRWRAAFLAAVIIGLLVHMPILLSDIPNHDGLDSIYFDQNMVTSGRWFLTVACGFSSFYSLPWVIGVLGIFFLGLSAAVLTELLEVEKKYACVLIGALLAVFPAIASTFAYVFTLDGYMLALFLALLSVLLTKKYKKGFLGGAVCLAFSLGTYQAYLPFAVLLSLAMLVMASCGEQPVKEKILTGVRYVSMGALGVVLYYVILKVMLLVQGKSLDTYQGISGMAEGTSGGLFDTVLRIYRDFAAFTLKGHVFAGNTVSRLGFLCMLVAVLLCGAVFVKQKKLRKNPAALVTMLAAAVLLPLATNLILLVSPNVTYHLLMRYQWVLFPVFAVAFVSKREEGKTEIAAEWLLVLAAAAVIANYAVTDNIAYSNLEKKYEKTYAYCLRLLDRIEQTPGYYQGMPVAMIGVVGDEQFPVTDVTGDVTGDMIGIGGDMLLYTGSNYEAFMKNYLGATVNFLPAEAMGEMYYDERYIAMDSFPGENSLQMIDGILYIKTENVNR